MRKHCNNYIHQRFVFIYFLLIFSTNIISGQNKYNFKDLGSDSETIIKQPSKWNSNDILTIFGVAGLTYGTMYLDQMVKLSLKKYPALKNSIPIEFGRIWGEPWFTAASGASFYIQGLAQENTKNKKIGFEIGESALYTSIITMLFKISFGRERPRENSDAFSFHPFSSKGDNFLSLNSGHTALAFSLSTVLANNTENNYLKVIFYIPAFMTAISRVYQNHHWTSDVLLGGFIGFGIAEFVTSLHKTKKQSDNSKIIPQNVINLVDFKIPL